MEQPEARPKFVRVARTHDIPPEEARAFRLGRFDIAVFNHGGEFYALENSCPHQGGPLADGWLEGPLVTCPWHGWCFDVRSGKMTLGDFARVPRFDVEVRGEDIFVNTEPADE